MSKGGGSAERNLEIQHEMDLSKWEYNRNRQIENFDYMTDGHAIAEHNAEQSTAFKNETAKNEWIYKEELRRFDFNQNIAAHNASIEAFHKQMDYNDLAFEMTAADNTRQYNERLINIGFQNQELMMKYGFDVKGMQLDFQAKEAEIGFKNQELAIEALHKTGAARASGQSGRTARMNMQAALAQWGRNQATLTDNILREADSYEFGLEKASAGMNLGKRQLEESMHSAKIQHAFDQQNAALQKYSADLSAESKITPLPVEPPSLPMPLEMPAPKIQAPQPIPSHEEHMSVKPLKGAIGGGGMGLLDVASTGLQIATAIKVLSAGSDDRLKYDITRVGTSPSGIPEYTFRYRADGKHGPKYIGTSAQDLLAMGRGDAVVQKEKDGFYSVDYSKLDVDFEQIQSE